MHGGWALVAGAAIGIAAWWWFSEDRVAAREAEAAAEARARAPVDTRLYRWRDASGNLHITDDAPPRGQAQGKVTRVEREPVDGIQVNGP